LRVSERDEDPNSAEVARVSGLRARLAPAALLLCAFVLGLSATAQAGVPLWSSAQIADSAGSPAAISCPSESLCVAVDGSGHVITTAEPLARVPNWSTELVDGTAIDAISCASDTLCVAVDHEGGVLHSTDPAAGIWTRQAGVDPHPLTGVSCPTSNLCVAVDSAGNAIFSTDPGSSPATWNPDGETKSSDLLGVSCPSESACVAIGSGGKALTTHDPVAAVAWTAATIDPTPSLAAISCASAGYCVAADSSGDLLARGDPAAAAPTWSITAVAPGASFASVSCFSVGLCVALDRQGTAFATEAPASSVPAWQESSADPGETPTGLSCSVSGFCVGVDATGHDFAGRVPAPVAVTTAASAVGEGSATLTGSVDPEGAPLQRCLFEYGRTTAYGSVASCSAIPSPTGGGLPVQAQIAGLEPDATYHYRLVAATAAGTGIGLDEAFTTTFSTEIALVHPNPSISGTPAVGQRLTCHPGTPAGSSARLSYVWLRDLIPIAGETGSVYPVKGQDAGHHLQCQVTATNGGGPATAKSAFVTIPVQGVPVAAGETSVGLARASAGRVLVPVACSTQAAEGCRIAVRLSVVEALSGRRITAVAAGPRPSRPHTAAVRRLTVTVGYTRVSLPAGQHRTIAVALSTTGRRLLAGRRTLPVELAVSGTVIGVIEAALARERLQIPRPGAHGAAAETRAVRLAPLELSSPPRATAAQAALLARTPYMGWDTYFAFGGDYSESTVLAQASRLITLGLAHRGFRYVWLDAGWWQGARGPDGRIEVNSRQWPHRMAWLAQTLHAAGLMVGLYTDAGPNGCGGEGQGSYGHYQQDANTFAAWGFDAVKVDFCGGQELHLKPASAYSAFHQALVANSSHRPMLLSICDYLQPGQAAEGEPAFGESSFTAYTYGPGVGNSWRTDTDVGLPGKVVFADVLRNMDADAASPQAAGPGHWNDPDYLGAGQGLSDAQFRSQLSMWSMLAAPLMVSDDLTKISSASLQALQNSEVLAIDQDPAGVQGTLVSTTGQAQVWVKPLADGSRAVALLNRGGSTVRISTSAAAAGLPAGPGYTLRNLWSNATTTTSGHIGANVAGDSTVLLRVYPR
jgi:hypothetical protein